MIDLRYKINDLILHTSEGKLCFMDRKLCIEPRLVNLLSFFARHPDTVFSREELIQAVWDGAIVTEQVVTQSVFELRKLLAECNQAGIITTIPKRGYKLSADVEEIHVHDLSCECEHPTTEACVAPLHEMRFTAAEPAHSSVRMHQPAAALNAKHPESDIGEQQNSRHTGHIAPFPAGPMSRALSSLSEDEGKPLLPSIASMANTLVNRLFDTIMLLVLVAIVSYLTIYQSSHQNMPELDNQLIAIEAQSDTRAPDQMGLLAYGISKQLQTSVEQFSQYRTRYLSGSPQTPGKRLIVSINYRDDGTYLTVRLYSHATERDIYQSNELLTGENLAQVIKHTEFELLDDLHVTLTESQRQALLSSLPADETSAKTLMLARYFLQQPEPVLMDKGIAMLDELIAKQPANGKAIALRYISYAQMLALTNQASEDKAIDNNVLRNYGQALTDYMQHHPALDTPEYWDAIALQALIHGKDTTVRTALAHSHQLLGDYTSLGYIILGKLSEKTHPVMASEAFSQAYYLDRSERTYLLCQSLVHHSELSQSAPVLAKLN
ncbi:winged helix-turn-helix domain-containing protein [Shewanella corallii]|uniref:Winged helix-turn-helix domain-containing protein n=1 Tax=Shewanella corallii TaxID=560080 RepID=A0ABT0NAL5_9GAMM|nr:winged helix-turn-helix domain-containing protein [Shewanella corallii]MCL2915464.1 winged helix-turn-helix domain-containing protein [Shewanella corallii]